MNLDTSIVMGILIMVLGWIGSRVHTKLDDLAARMEVRLDGLNRTLNSIERDLRGDLVSLDRRVTRVEARCDEIHPGQGPST
jgi:hypothetical protein